MRYRQLSMRTACLAGAAAVVMTAAAACGSTGSGNTSKAGSGLQAAPVKAGGTITVLEGKGFAGDWPQGLDPTTDVNAAADQDQMTAIFGQLFKIDSKGVIQPDLATSYSYSPDAKTVTIKLRQGVKFSDGTPFNAQAVVYNWTRLFGPIATKAGVALTSWLVTKPPAKPGGAATLIPGAIQATDPYTVVVHQTAPNAAFVNQLFDTWPAFIGSPTAMKSMGDKAFAEHPVGAGPFTVVSNNFSSQLVVKKNPLYWDAPKPYLDGITFKTVSGDEAGYESLLGGQGQVYPDLSTTALLNQAGQHFQVENSLGTSPYDLQLNSAIPPFNNPKARQAIYAATDFAPILKKIFGNKYPVVQGFTGPGGICYTPKVAGYQGYDPVLAKKLVQESGLDKTTIQLGTINSSQVAVQTTEALRSEWEALGIHSTIQSWDLTGLIAAFEKNNGKAWQAMIQTAGAYDPAAGVGVGFRFQSMSLFSGTHDPALDKILAQAQSTPDLSTRCGYYKQAQEYIAKNFYGPFYFAFSPANVSVKGVGGPGLTTPLPSFAVVPTIFWEDIYYNPSGK